MSNIADPLERIDQRAQRTRQFLAEALMSLGAHDVDIDALNVGCLTQEADICRSTFYQHFASKEDFLVRSFVDMIAAAEAGQAARHPDRHDIVPSGPLFAHIWSARGLARAMTRSNVYARQMSAAEIKLRVIAAANLERRLPSWSDGQRRAAAVFIVGGFVALLRWWMENGLQQKPECMHAAFERLVENFLAAAS